MMSETSGSPVLRLPDLQLLDVGIEREVVAALLDVADDLADRRASAPYRRLSAASNLLNRDQRLHVAPVTMRTRRSCTHRSGRPSRARFVRPRARAARVSRNRAEMRLENRNRDSRRRRRAAGRAARQAPGDISCAHTPSVTRSAPSRRSPLHAERADQARRHPPCCARSVFRRCVCEPSSTRCRPRYEKSAG